VDDIRERVSELIPHFHPVPLLSTRQRSTSVPRPDIPRFLQISILK
jgi:hypothetical protein